MRKRIFIIYSYIIVGISGMAILLVLFSWLSNLYGVEVHNLLSAEGVRWILHTSLTKVQNSFPFLSMMILFMGIGVFYKSTLMQAIIMILKWKSHNLSYKQRWAFRISLVVLMFYLLLIVWGVFSSNSILLGVTGGLKNSPLIDGFALWTSIGLFWLSAFYGWLTGKFRHPHEIVAGMVYGVEVAAPILVILFIFLHFFLMCQYVFQ